MPRPVSATRGFDLRDAETPLRGAELQSREPEMADHEGEPAFCFPPVGSSKEKLRSDPLVESTQDRTPKHAPLCLSAATPQASSFPYPAKKKRPAETGRFELHQT